MNWIDANVRQPEHAALVLVCYGGHGVKPSYAVGYFDDESAEWFQQDGSDFEYVDSVLAWAEITPWEGPT